MPDFFRKEALEHQKHKLEGEVTLATHMSFSVIAFLIFAIVVAGFAYLILGEYQRKEAVAGYLRPTSGLNKVYSVASGVIDEVYVTEGDIVAKGQRLVTIRLDRHLSSGLGANDVIIQELITQKNILTLNIANEQESLQINRDNLSFKINNAQARLKQASKQIALLKERIANGERKLKIIEELNIEGYASRNEYVDQQDNILALRQALEDIYTTNLSAEDQLNQLQYEYQQLPIEHHKQVSDLQSQLAGINQQIFQADSQRSFDVISNQDGVVTSQLVKTGMVASTNQPLMTILPKDVSLQAVLFVPTRAYGFIKEEQKTHIRYQAFPYQRFGIFEGEIVEVSKSVILPNETLLPVSFEEPVYRVIVNLNHQEVLAYGISVPLQAGMLLEADILVDTRSLFEWLFEPLYSIKGAA